MKHCIFYTILFSLFFTSCKKDCEEDLVGPNKNFIYYNNLFPCEENGNVLTYEIYHKSLEAYYKSNCRSSQPVGVLLDFDGIVLAQSVEIPFWSMDYESEVYIIKNPCDKSIHFHFKVMQVDATLPAPPPGKSAFTSLAFIDHVDSSYTVSFSHEVIPLK